MQKKNDKRRSLLKKGLVIAVIIEIFLIDFKNIDHAYFYLKQWPLGFSVFSLFILFCTSVIAIHKIKFCDFGRITILEILEWTLALMAIFCYSCINDKGDLASLDSFTMKKIISCMYLSIGIIGSIVLSNLLMAALAKEKL